MTPSALIRASGLSAIVGGVGFVLFPLLHPNHDAAGYTSAIWVPAHMMPNIGAILALYGLVGLLARQLERAGWPGLVGFVVAFFGTASVVMGAMIEAFIIPFMGLQSPEIMDGPPPPGVGEAFMTINLVFTIGYVILGIATYRAAVLPRSVGLLLAIGAGSWLVFQQIGNLVLSLDALWAIGPVVLGCGLSWLGYTLWTMTPDALGTSQSASGDASSRRLVSSAR